MLDIGFTRSEYDHCVYIKHTSGIYIYLLLYVDDMLVACKDMGVIDDLKKKLSQRFDMKDLGAARKIIGIDIIRDWENGILKLSQKITWKRC